MPVSSGRWLSSSVNASRPPAEAPTPTMGGELPSARFPAAGCTIATAETGLTAAVEVFPGGVVRRFGRGESGARGERATSPGRRLPVFFAKRHHYLSPRDERASSLEREPDQQSTLRATFAPASAPAPYPRGWRPANCLNCNAVAISQGGPAGIQPPSIGSGTCEQVLDDFADLHELIQTGRLGDEL